MCGLSDPGAPGLRSSGVEKHIALQAETFAESYDEFVRILKRPKDTPA